MTRAILRLQEGGECSIRQAQARLQRSARRAAQRVDEPVELDGVSYSADVLSAVEG
jgi:hypothetical protein